MGGHHHPEGMPETGSKKQTGEDMGDDFAQNPLAFAPQELY